MNQFTAILALVTLTLSATVSANPCMSIAEACMKEGYYKGGDTVGKGLVKDCVQPIVSKTKILPNTAFSDIDLEHCAAMLKQRMQ